MKICMPVISNEGLASPINPHFGSAPMFLIVDSDTLSIQEIENTNEHHAHGMCQPLSVLAHYAFDAIVVGGIGLGALNKLKAGGYRVFRSEFKTVKETVEAVTSGNITEMEIESACRGHGCH